MQRLGQPLDEAPAVTASVVDVWFPAAGSHGPGVRGGGAAAAAGAARAGHRVGGIGPPP